LSTKWNLVIEKNEKVSYFFLSVNLSKDSTNELSIFSQFQFYFSTFLLFKKKEIKSLSFFFVWLFSLLLRTISNKQTTKIEINKQEIEQNENKKHTSKNDRAIDIIYISFSVR